MRPNIKKVEAAIAAPAPTDVTQLRSFLGLMNFYGRFLPNLSSVLAPLHKLLHVLGISAVGSFQSRKVHVGFLKIASPL